MTTTPTALTIDICTEDGTRTRFVQADAASAERALRQLVSPRLFGPPLLTLASEHSVSAIPTRTVDMILAYTASPPPLPLPGGWVDAVEVSDDAVINLEAMEAVAAAEHKHVMLAEVHTLGDWTIRLRLETILPETIQERRRLWNHLLDLPAIPFRLKAGGLGAINTANIVRATVSPPSFPATHCARPSGCGRPRCVGRTRRLAATIAFTRTGFPWPSRTPGRLGWTR